jgi:two-component system chemotaxis response regulator CheY
MKALVVDDSRVMRVMLSNVLKEVGFTEVSQAEHGKDGLDFLNHHPDTQLALVDWNMPEMTGIEMVQAARQNRFLDRCKIVMVTTESEKSQVVHALTAGADEYVLKPFTKDVIADKLKQIGFSL